MNRKLFLFIAILLLANLSFSYELIIDNNDTTHCLVTNEWDTWTTNTYGGTKFVHGPGTGTDKVTYQTPIIPGWYKVDVRINSNTTYTTEAHYQVIHRDGTDNISITQVRGSSGWFVLGGAFYFDGTATVILSDEFTSAQGSYIIADAIRFQSVFSFIQMSDSHAGYGPGNTQGGQIGVELQSLGKMQMAGYGFSAPPPSFGIHCGDATEYGKEYWDELETMFQTVPFPLYFTLGNHDSTWNSTKETIKSLFGNSHYSFDYTYGGTKHHFVCLDSTILQTPRPGFSREELDWFAADLAAQPAGTPIFVFFHHPFVGSDLPRNYDMNRVMDILKPYVGVILFMGHGHSAVKQTFDNYTFIEGGSTYNDSTGTGSYNIITVVHNRVWVAKKVYGEATAATGLLNAQTIPTSTSYPTISITSPVKDSIQTGADVSISASISGTAATVSACDVELDGSDTWVSLTGSGYGPYTGLVNLSSKLHGRHWIRVRFTMSTGGPFYKTIPFWHWDGYPKPRWIVDLGASSLSTPIIYNEKVYVGTHGGTFRCVDANYGSEIWKVNVPSDVMSTPEVVNGKVYFGCGNGKIYCLNADTGAEIWNKTLSGPVYSSPTVSEGNVYIGCNGTGASNSAYIYSLNATTGNQNWSYAVGNAIESKPYVLNGVVYVGCWDNYFYAVNTSTGTLKWKYTRASNRYLSPADSWPVASAGANKVYVADREYQLNAINITTGAGEWTRSGVSSQTLSPDATSLIIRNSASGAKLDNINFDNTSTIWSSSCDLDSAAVAPMTCGTRVCIVEQMGKASVVSSATGSIEYQFQTSQNFELHPVNIDYSGNLYASTYEGFLICVENSAPPAKTIPDIVLESRDSSGNLMSNPPYSELLSGTAWQDSVSKSIAAGLVGLGSRYNVLTDGLTAKASAVPNILTTGEYSVYVTWGTDANANNISYVIKHRDGTATVQKDQKPVTALNGTNGNTWHKLGKYYFNAGQNESVGSITVDESSSTGPNTVSYNSGKVYSDGYMFAYEPEFTPTPTLTPTPTFTPSPSPTPSPTPTPGAPPAYLVIDDFQTYAAEANLDAVWAGSTGSTSGSLKTSGGAGSTTKWIEMQDGGWTMNLFATFTNKVIYSGNYKFCFYYKNGHVNNPQGSLVITFKDGSGNTKGTFNLGSNVQTTWAYMESANWVSFNANDTIRIEVTGTYSGTLTQSCAFDEIKLLYEVAPPTATPTASPTASPTATPTNTPTPIPTETPVYTPTPSPIPTATPIITPTATPVPTETPEPTPTPQVTASPTPVSAINDWQILKN